MSLSDLASIGSLASGVAVLASLVYLSYEIRQNSKHTRALIHLGRTDRLTTNAIALADADLCSAYISGAGENSTPEKIKRRQFALQCHVMITGWQDNFTQYREGLLDEDHMLATRFAITRNMSNTGVRAYWNEWKSQVIGNAAFKVYIDSIVDATI